MIPTLNDDPAETRKLADWILTHLGPDVPLHFTAFHPDFKLQDKPRTPAATLDRARQIALDAGLHYVYEGNIYSKYVLSSVQGTSGAPVLARRAGKPHPKRLLRKVRLRDYRCLGQ